MKRFTIRIFSFVLSLMLLFSAFNFSLIATAESEINRYALPSVAVDITATSDEITKANKFREENATLLGKNASNIADSDKADFDACLAAFAQLSNGSKDVLKEENALLIEMLEVLYPASYTSISAFANGYSTLLNKEVSSYTNADFDALKGCYDAYKTLEEEAKVLSAYPYKAKLDMALKNISDNPIERAEGDFSSIVADFEYEQNPFVKILADEGQYSEKIVDDPTGADNKVLQLQLVKGIPKNAIWMIDDRLWPKGSAQYTRFSFKVYSSKLQNVTTPYFIYDYTDEENMQVITYQESITSDKGWLWTRKIVDDATSSINPRKETIIFGEWMNLEFVVDSVKSKCSVILSTSQSSTVVNLDYTAGSKVGFGFKAGYRKASQPVYIDDVKIEFEEGDFDLNETNKEIFPYYQGNTFQNPDETVLITGDSYFGTNVESADLYALPDTTVDITNPQYVFETRFNKSKINDGVVSQPVNPSWSEQNAVTAPFVQKTKTSVKFVLPKADKKSIYAVRLNAAHKDVDEAGNRLYNDKIIYLNNPYITYTMADDGEIATVGGWLRVFGENLYIDSAHKVLVVAKALQTGAIIPLNVAKVVEGDAYSVEVSIPQDMIEGKYEIYLHNGYGDNTCWSAPVVITVGKSARDIWRSKGTFNVKDYGAMGDDVTNDTGAIISAIAAAYKNGGGVVYFPAGKYRVISTIVVPQNVSIEGHSPEDTMIFWSAYTWQYNEANQLFSIYGNCEIKNLHIYATRAKEVIYANVDEEPNVINKIFGDPSDSKKDNVYLENLIIRKVPVAGAPTMGGHAWPNVDGTDQAVISALVTKEAVSNMIHLKSGGKNIQLSNLDLLVETNDIGFNVAGAAVSGHNVIFKNIYNNNQAINGVVRNAIVEDCYFERGCSGVNGSNLYFARNQFAKRYKNNRELWVSDGVPYYKNVRVQFIGEREDIMGVGKTDEVSYKLIGSSNLPEDMFVGMEIYVADGQGYGQMRRIVEGHSDGTFKVDQPFVVAPNRNSAIWIFWPRTTNYFVQNSFVEGSAAGPYGTSVDLVWDGNKFEYHNGQMFTNGHTVVWYTSILNETYRKPLYVHGEGYGGTPAGPQTDNKIFIQLVVADTTASFMGTVIKNNDFGAYYIRIEQNQITEALRDFIVEHNIMNESPAGISSNVADTDSYKFDGVYIRDNDFDTTGAIYADVLVNALDNRLGYKRCIIVNTREEVFVLGDVNFDGKVSIKDATLICYYYLGKLEFSEKQLLRADANEDGIVSIKDSTRIRQHIINGVVLGKIDVGYYPGNW